MTARKHTSMYTPVSEENKAELMRRKSAQDPVALNSRLNKAVERLLKTN